MNLRSTARKANLKRWKATPPAVIESPLKAIHKACPDFRDEHGNFAGYHPAYEEAFHASNRGDGATVKRIARAI